MAKYYGAIGYAETREVSPGVWEEKINERMYYGDVIRNARRLEAGMNVNDNPIIANSISIVADAYAYQNILAIRYVTWLGARWKVSNAEIQAPRLILTIGDVYNGPEN